MPQLWIIQDRFDSPTITDYCKCNTLEDYLRFIYKNMNSQYDDFSLINENKIILLAENRSAIQSEYEFSLSDTKIHAFTVFTNNNDDSFYQFIYYGDSESFSKYLSQFKKIIDTIEFPLQKMKGIFS